MEYPVYKLLYRQLKKAVINQFFMTDCGVCLCLTLILEVSVYESASQRRFVGHVSNKSVTLGRYLPERLFSGHWHQT